MVVEATDEKHIFVKTVPCCVRCTVQIQSLFGSLLFRRYSFLGENVSLRFHCSFALNLKWLVE